MNNFKALLFRNIPVDNNKKDSQQYKNKATSATPQSYKLLTSPPKNDDEIYVGFVGNFLSGKSTIINALLGQAVVSSDIIPCTPVLNYIKFGSEKVAFVRFSDEEDKRMSYDKLSDYVIQDNSNTTETATTVMDILIYHPSPLLQNNVVFVDTPGLNNCESCDSITKSALSIIDVAVMTLNATSPFSENEAEFVRNVILEKHVKKIIFLLNRIDCLEEEIIPKAIDLLKSKIDCAVFVKIAELYGKDSKEYMSAKEIIGEIHLYTISARNALKGKINNDLTLISESGIDEFEKALSNTISDILKNKLIYKER